MRITKYGHCCLLVEEQDQRILIDPGVFTIDKHSKENIDVILITHEHTDHLHVPSVKAVLAESPKAKIYTIPSVGELLKKEGIEFSLLTHGQSVREGEVLIEAFGKDHAVIHPDFPLVANTGFFIAERFFFPGDAFTDPGKKPEILALPIVAPWLKFSEAIEYARKLKPDVCFPVHDGIVVDAFRPILSMAMPQKLLESHGIRMLPGKDGEVMEF